MGNGITRIDSGQIRSVANQFDNTATCDLAEAIGRARSELDAVAGMFGTVPDDHPSRQFEAAYRQHAGKMLGDAETLVRGLLQVGAALQKMANDFDQADVNATVT